MRLLFSSALVTICLIPMASAAPKVSPVSWGKPGVSLEQYRHDAVECGTAAYYMDVSGTEAAKVFQRATKQLENNESDLQTVAATDPDTQTYNQIQAAARSASIVHGTQPEKRLREVGDYQNRGLAICLTERGYKRFTLTKAQQDHLRRLKNGSPERHEYLYSLSVDPKVLHDQAS
jgi:hypothetical protein